MAGRQQRYPSHVQALLDAAVEAQDTRPRAVPGTVWRLWFPARLRARKRVRTVNGERVTDRVKAPQLPPGPNGSRGNPIAHAKWVKVWRDAACEAAADIPFCGRIRVSSVMRRRAIGTADEDNDRARLKPLVDGLRDAGVIRKDTRGHVVYGPCSEERAGPEGPGVLLIVEALEGGGS